MSTTIEPRVNLEMYRVWLGQPEPIVEPGIAVVSHEGGRFLYPQYGPEFLPSAAGPENPENLYFRLHSNAEELPDAVHGTLYLASLAVKAAAAEERRYEFRARQQEETLYAPHQKPIGRGALLAIVGGNKIVMSTPRKPMLRSFYTGENKSGKRVHFLVIPERESLRIGWEGSVPLMYEARYSLGEKLVIEPWQDDDDDAEEPGGGGDREPRQPILPSDKQAVQIEHEREICGEGGVLVTHGRRV